MSEVSAVRAYDRAHSRRWSGFLPARSALPSSAVERQARRAESPTDISEHMNRTRPKVSRDGQHSGLPPRRRRALLVIPVLGTLVLVLLWTVIFARLSVEREATTHESMASAAILSSALEQHTIKAIHQVDQITRFVKYEYEKSPDNFDLIATVEKGVVQSDTLVQVSLI